MISFDDRHGPADAAPATAYPDLSVPDWYRDAKLGIFVHWGLYSVPAWADVLDRSDVTAENAYARHQYAEWYANTVRIEDSPTRARHEEIYGVGHSYEDFADQWHPAEGSVGAIVDLARRAGGRYLMLTTKHHDGFCLWDSATTPFHAVGRGPGRDLVAEFESAVRRAGMKYGFYYSGAHDWHATDFPPLHSNAELFALRRNDPAFAAFAAAQLRELIERYSPDVLWNDIDWPDAGKYEGPDSLQQLFREYLAAVPGGMINDRWGVPVHGVLTREYQDIDAVQSEVFESTRGLGLSFGYNADESTEHALDGDALIRQLVDVVSKNGNLLINVGPRADGSIPELQAAALTQLGEWLDAHGGAIYGTRPWFHPAVATPPEGVRFTLGTSADGQVADAQVVGERVAGEHAADGPAGGGLATDSPATDAQATDSPTADGPAAGTPAGGGTRSVGRGVLHALLLDPAAGPVTLDEQVSAAIREIAEVPGDDRITLSPTAGQDTVAVVTLPLR